MKQERRFTGPRWIVEPIWLEETVVILAGGPSLTQQQVDYCRGKAKIIAINDSAALAPWADLLYAADQKWWWHPKKRPIHETFTGVKVSLERTDLPGVLRVDQAKVSPTTAKNSPDAALSFEPGVVVTAGNSGYQAINLAVQLGARKIVLLGFDMKMGPKGEIHHHGSHPDGLNNPKQHNFGPWVDRYKELCPVFSRIGVTVVNSTPGSALKCFPHLPIEQALEAI